MNLPNRLTLARILIIPIIIIVTFVSKLREIFVFESVNLEDLIVLILFCIASFTDFLDGHIARKNNIVTNIGKFMDPLADKMLVLTAFIFLIERGKFQAFGIDLGFCVTLILSREFVVTGLRTIAAKNNQVIAASKLGKAKTVSQMFTIIVLLINCYPFAYIGGNSKDIVTAILVGIVLVLTIVSGVDYFIKNKNVFKEEGK